MSQSAITSPNKGILHRGKNESRVKSSELCVKYEVCEMTFRLYSRNSRVVDHHGDLLNWKKESLFKMWEQYVEC